MFNDACPGCDVLLPVATDGYAPDRYNASAACWQLYGELSSSTLTHDDGTFLHQHVVDTYAAQHSGATRRPITVAFALIGLYLAVERGYTGRKVQQAHQQRAALSKEWPRFVVPAQAGDVTVADVVRGEQGVGRDTKLRTWSIAVWGA